MSASAMASAPARANSSALVASCLPNLVIPTPITATRRMALLLENPAELISIILRPRATEKARRIRAAAARMGLPLRRPRTPQLRVQGDAILAGPLGRVERLVRGAHQCVGRGLYVLGQRRDPEARGDGLAVGEVEGGEHVAD